MQHVQQHFVPLPIQQPQLKHETYTHLTSEELVHRVHQEHNEQSGSVNTEKNITEFDHPLSVTSPAAPGVEPSINPRGTTTSQYGNRRGCCYSL